MHRLLVAAALCLAASAAHAQQMKAAASGKPLLLGQAYNIARDCSADGLPTIKVAVAPSHGRIRIGTARFFPANAFGYPGHPCNQRRVLGTQAQYISRRGYTGPDQVTLEIIYPAGRYLRRSFAIVVR